MKRPKIAIIGSGSVGSTTAYALMLTNTVAEIILVDLDTKRCKGEVHDLSDTLPFSRASSIYQGSFSDAAQADIIIISAGKAQKPGQSRADLLTTNCSVIKNIFDQLKPLSSSAIIIMVSNPLDVLTLCAQKYSGIEPHRIFGSGTFLDSQRLQGILADKLNIAQESIYAYVLGEHGDSQFIAWSSIYIHGILLDNLITLTPEERDTISQQTRERAQDIINCKGATFFGIATCVSALCQDIIFDQKRVSPVSCYNKEFDIYLSAPAVIGAEGIIRVLPLALNNKEKELFKNSAQKIKELVKQCSL